MIVGVLCVVGSTVFDLVDLLANIVADFFLEGKASVIGGDSDFHDLNYLRFP